jgi:hypothetical protein
MDIKGISGHNGYNNRILQFQFLVLLFASKLIVTVLVPLYYHVPTEI